MSKPKKPDAERTPRQILDEMGIDGLCGRITDGMLGREIARSIGVSNTSLVEWIGASDERVRRVTSARMSAAQVYEEEADELIRSAADPFELAKAKELAHHLRWRASKLNKGLYGDKLDLNHGGEIKVKKTASDMTDDELATIAAGKAGRNADA